MTPEIETHPVQNNKPPYTASRLSTKVTLRAYEVYKHCFGAQEAIITGDCRGGFGVNEIISFLYAYPFPKNEWRQRVDEAMKGMEGL